MFVDTNVILRWLLGDHPEMSRQAARLVADHSAGELMVTDVVLAEVFYVLRGMRFDRRQIAQYLSALFTESAFSFEGSFLPYQLLTIIETTRLDFADCYLISRAIFSEQPLRTFDKPMQKAYKKYRVKKP